MIILVICITVGISYAVWQLSYQQTNVNKIVSSCFSLEIINEKDDIKLEDAYPVEDSIGEGYTPFKFTVKNICDLFASYSIALEVDSASTLESKYVKAKIDSDKANVLTAFDNGTPTIEGYDESHILTTGTLGAGEESDEYNLRLWMDNLTPASEATMNKTFLSKIVVTGEPSTYSPVEQRITKLSDAMLANEYQTTVDIAKQKIKEKSEPDFSKTAPIITWAQHTGSNITINVDKPHQDINGSFGLTGESGIINNNQKVILGAGYTFDSSTGYYTLTDIMLVDPTTIEDYAAKNYYYCNSYINVNVQNNSVTTGNQYQNCSEIYKISSTSKTTFGESSTNLYRIRYELKVTILEHIELESDKSDKGLYVARDDLGDTYYYRGSVKNNFVKLGENYWRIIRQNGDGTVRIIYNGPTADQTGSKTQIGTKEFNTKYNDPAYVGYMYGNNLGVSKEATQANDDNSTMKTYLESWYTTNIENKNLSSVVADGIFCNDRSITTGNGYSTTETLYYGAYDRLVTKKEPNLKCSVENDRFTQNEQIGAVKGNAKNTKPVGLITADEVAMAGAVNGSYNRLFWLYTGQTYWAMSPFYFWSNSAASCNWNIFNDGRLHSWGWVNNASGVRPVINISSTAEISEGIGTAKDPFVIKVN